jgi:hypothetical protein
VSWALGLGAFLALAVGVAHSVLGERYVLTRLFRRDNLPKLIGGTWFTRRVLRFAWHLTSVAWWGFAAQLAWAGGFFGSDPTVAGLLRVVAVTFGVSALVTLAASRGRHLAWVVFLAIAACAW